MTNSSVCTRKVGKDGRITLPKAMLKSLGWKPGSTLLWETANVWDDNGDYKVITLSLVPGVKKSRRKA